MPDQNRVCQGHEDPWVLINPYSDDPSIYARLIDYICVRLPNERVEKLPSLSLAVTQPSSTYG